MPARLEESAAAAAAPCYAIIDGTVEFSNAVAVETVCYTSQFDYRDGVILQILLRSYPPASAFVVESSTPDDPGNSFEDNLFQTSSFLFDYLTSFNSKSQNLTGARTAPFTLRPPVAGRTAQENWVGAMALAPSVWHPAGKPQPPASTIPSVDVVLFGGVTMAVNPKLLTSAPTEDDFRAAYQELEISLNFLPLPGRWVINTSSPLTPSFNFLFGQDYNGSAWRIEAAAEVYHVSD